ncbi:DUF1540 domain-containing protein [Paenibacillus sepulcri]|uniref:DUF1540 domain-containing protein n=1 Tax=Paenibacillus sepulcri TaxID=359917 RepID=A0ABS7C612_9BACL|nr:DUF1540 domain-containing protein [Paenibacillus sepulcri]
MEHPMVKCSVANCQHWESGNNCVAETIMIEINTHANSPLPQGSGSGKYDTKHQDSAGGVTDTCCHTFQERTH